MAVFRLPAETATKERDPDTFGLGIGRDRTALSRAVVDELNRRGVRDRQQPQTGFVSQRCLPLMPR
jgi:hypothetical protein